MVGFGIGASGWVALGGLGVVDVVFGRIVAYGCVVGFGFGFSSGAFVVLLYVLVGCWVCYLFTDCRFWGCLRLVCLVVLRLLPCVIVCFLDCCGYCFDCVLDYLLIVLVYFNSFLLIYSVVVVIFVWCDVRLCLLSVCWGFAYCLVVVGCCVLVVVIWLLDLW